MRLTKHSPLANGAFVICAVFLGILFARPPLLAISSLLAPPGQDRFIQTPIGSFDQLRRLLIEVKRHNLPEPRLLQKIRIGGLSFTVTEDEIQQLAAAGASQSLMEAVRRFIPAAPPAQPQKRDGILIVLCEPVDCAISLDGKAIANTTEGKSQPISLQEGTYKVQPSVQDYESDQRERSVSIPAGATVTQAFYFHPTKRALEAAGKQLYDRLVSALGGEGILKDCTRFRAAGTLNLFDRDGRQSAWDLTVYYKAPDTARFILGRGNRKYNVLYTGREGYRWDKAPAEAPSLEDVLFRICQFQIANILRQLGSPPFTLISNHAVLASDSTLRAEGSPDAYVVEFDSSSHVNAIRIESSGLNNGMRATYGEYTAGPNRVYSRVTQVRLPDGPRHGIDLHFADLAYNPADLTDEIFVLKTKKR